MDFIIILDESGSMSQMGSEPLDAVNEFINKQKDLFAEDSKCTVSLVTFNSTPTLHLDQLPLKDFNKFTMYNPKNMTALYDTIGTTINDLWDLSSPELISRESVLIIVTDGHDTCSKYYTQSQIKTLIERVENVGKCKVVYLAANQNAFDVGSNYGVSVNRCSTFSTNSSDKCCLFQAFRTLSGSIETYSYGGSEDITM